MNLTNDERRTLIQAAVEIRKRAYVPYSNYPVGAAVRTKTGKIYTGVNVENAAPLLLGAQKPHFQRLFYLVTI